jgi:hypothetical protein
MESLDAPVDLSADGLDQSENDKHQGQNDDPGYHGGDLDKVNYYIGNPDERRVVWSVGRDLIMQPPQEDGPVNSLPKVYVEVDGKQFTDWSRQFTYTELFLHFEEISRLLVLDLEAENIGRRLDRLSGYTQLRLM